MNQDTKKQLEARLRELEGMLIEIDEQVDWSLKNLQDVMNTKAKIVRLLEETRAKLDIS